MTDHVATSAETVPSLFHRAHAFHQSGQLAEAVDLYRQVLNIEPTHTDTMCNLGSLMAAIGAVDDAETLYRAALELSPDDVAILVNLGNLLQVRGTREQAMVCYQRALNLDPDLAAVHVNLGKLLLDSGQVAAAIPHLQCAADLAPMAVEPKLNLAVATALNGDGESAVRLLETVLADHPDHVDALTNLAGLLQRAGRSQEALDIYRRVVGLQPDHCVAHFNLASQLELMGDFEAAKAAYHEAVGLDPSHGPSVRGLGSLLTEIDELDEADRYLSQAVELLPDDPGVHFSLGTMYNKRGEYDQAIAAFHRALDLNGESAEIFNNLGTALLSAQRFAEAGEILEQAVALDPTSANAHNNLGNAYHNTGRPKEAEAAYRRALEILPDFPVAIINLGHMYRDLGKTEDAKTMFRQAIEFDPGNANAHNGLGVLYLSSYHNDEALELFDKALEIEPGYIEALNNKALALANMGRRLEALQVYRDSLDQNSNRIEVLYNMASLLTIMGRNDEAVRAYYQVLHRRPDFNPVYPYLGHALMHQCAWSNLDSVIEKVYANTAEEIANDQPSSTAPFALIAFGASSELRQQVAEQVAVKVKREIKNLVGEVEFNYIRQRGDKIRVGYFSPDFRRHSAGLVFKGVADHHHHDDLEFHGYLIGNYGRDHITDHFRETFDHFHDLEEAPALAAAEKLHADGIDILVDLAGHTRGTRLDILALRPAPVQAHFLGYGSTIGGNLVDYLITDRTSFAEAELPWLSEQPVYLPETSMPGTVPEFEDVELTRDEAGLPETATVFCNFNAHYKFEPASFALWMRLMKRVPDSVFWLLEGSKEVRRNLRQEAELRGIDPTRLIFAPRMDHAQHLARLKLADICLDTLSHSGGVTSQDAMWRDVPVVTMPGKTANSRTSTLLNQTLDLPELNADSTTAYEEIAYRLATDPDRLAAARAKLRHNRIRQPAFDIERFTAHLEDGYRLMWQNYLDGKPPRRIDVPCLPPRSQPFDED